MCSAATAEMAAHEMRMPTRYVPQPDDGCRRVPARVYPEIRREKPGDYLSGNRWSCWSRCRATATARSHRSMSCATPSARTTRCARSFDGFIGKAATVPALTTTTGWAAELVRTERQAFMESLQPASGGRAGCSPRPARSPSALTASSAFRRAIADADHRRLVRRRGCGDSGAARRVHGDPAVAEETGGDHGVLPGNFRTFRSGDRGPAAHRHHRGHGGGDRQRADGCQCRDRGAAGRPAQWRLDPDADRGRRLCRCGRRRQAAVGALQTITLGNVRSPVWLMSPALALALRLHGGTEHRDVRVRRRVSRRRHRLRASRSSCRPTSPPIRCS